MAPLSRAPLRLLLVDDSPLVRRALKRALVSAGFEVLDVDGIEAARAALSREKFEVVVSDDDLGGSESGLAILAEARAVAPETRRALMSGTRPEKLDQHLRSGLVERFHEKPIEVADLRALYVWVSSG